MSDDARLEALEFRLAHLERALQELGDVAYRQQRELDALGGRYQRLVDRLESAERRGAEPPAFEVPPHY